MKPSTTNTNPATKLELEHTATPGTTRVEDPAPAMSLLRYTNSRRPTVMTDHESLPANTPGLPYVGVTSHVLLCELLDEHNRPAPTPPGSSVDRDDDPVVWFVAHPIVAIRVVTPALASELGEVLGRLVDAPAV